MGKATGFDCLAKSPHPAIINTSRDVAQLGSALPWGGRGHEFKSHRSDHDIDPALSRAFYLGVWARFVLAEKGCYTMTDLV